MPQARIVDRAARVALCGAILWLLAATVAAEVSSAPSGAFEIRRTVVLPGTPEEIYAGLTGDISGWWDHSFSATPSAFYIDARPGGGFYEYFDAGRENGVLHATVIYAERGRKLTFRGPLGLSGNALDLVVTYTLEKSDEPSGTRLGLRVSGAGRVEEDWPATVDAVWEHFLVKRFTPWVEAGCHLAAGCRHPPKW